MPDSVLANFNGIDYEFSVECRNNFEVVLTVTNTLSVLDVENALSTITLYPNPSSNQITIENNTSVALTNVVIFDISGRKVEEFFFREELSNPTISIRELSAGTYFMQLSSENLSTTKRIIKE